MIVARFTPQRRRLRITAPTGAPVSTPPVRQTVLRLSRLGLPGRNGVDGGLDLFDPGDLTLVFDNGTI